MRRAAQERLSLTRAPGKKAAPKKRKPKAANEDKKGVARKRPRRQAQAAAAAPPAAAAGAGNSEDDGEGEADAGDKQFIDDACALFLSALLSASLTPALPSAALEQ